MSLETASDRLPWPDARSLRGLLAFNADEGFQACDLARESGAVGYVDDAIDVFIGKRCFLRDAAERWAANQDAARGQFVDELPAAVAAASLPAAHGAAGTVAG